MSQCVGCLISLKGFRKTIRQIQNNLRWQFIVFQLWKGKR